MKFANIIDIGCFVCKCYDFNFIHLKSLILTNFGCFSGFIVMELSEHQFGKILNRQFEYFSM